MSNDPQRLAPLLADELIDDRALQAVGDDAFRLRDFVNELVALCEKATIPANVALFGAWGSGKSSLANLLAKEFDGTNHKAVAFARFDAFKYAEIPLRRHFLSQIAKAFDIKDDKYSDGLYRTTKKNNYHVPARKLFNFGKLVATVTLCVVILLLIVTAIVSAVSAIASKAAFLPIFSKALQGSISAVIIGSGLLSAFIALAGKTFTVESTQGSPSTEEEFDRLFQELVAEIVRRKKCKRIVIFIDELDRCSPGQVVTVLETIRTFLDIPPCVFVVAADQQAVEHALTEKVRQTTPGDAVNPYYSAGSAYLDKIFQHQLALPPLLPRTLSQFALNLIADRVGIWRQIANKSELVTVLVPTHVRSPRRVKVLLNNFVLAYRLALQRSSAGALDSGVAERASEMAKLVCLRTEFPLFAADLRIDARMPQATLALANNDGMTLSELGLVGFSEEAFNRARAYASGCLPLDEIIVRSSEPDAGPQSQDIADDPAQPADNDSEDEAGHEADYHAEPADVSSIVKGQARQLIAYLRRTEKIAGPSRDLVFLESSGAVVGLDAELADELERNAQNGETEAVIGTLASLDTGTQEAALHLLCHLVRETIGLDAKNTCHCLLEALDVTKVELDSVVDDVLTALQALTSEYVLEIGDLAGALEISLLRTTGPAMELRKQVLARDETRTDESLGLLVLSHAEHLVEGQRSLIAPVFSARLLSSPPESFFEAIKDLADSFVAELVTEQEEDILATLATLEGEEAATHLGAIAEYAVSNRKQIAPRLIRLLLLLDSLSARNAAEPLLARIAPITDEALLRQVLVAVGQRRISGWASWLEPLERASVAEIENIPALISTLNRRILGQRNAAENPASDEEAANAIDLLNHIHPDGVPIPSEEFEGAFQQAVASPVVNNDQVDVRLALHQIVHRLAQADLLPVDVASRLSLTDMNNTLGQPIELGAGTERLPEYVLTTTNFALDTAVVVDIDATIAAVTNSPWLAAQHKDVIVLYSHAIKHTLGEDVPEPLGVDQLAALVNVGSDAYPALAAWTRSFKPAPDAVQNVFGTLSSKQDLATSLRDAIFSLAQAWSDDQRRQFFSGVATRYVRDEIGLSLVAAARLPASDEGILVAELASLFDNANNNIERERIMRLWHLTQPGADSARRTLIDRVYIPLIRQGKGAAKIALDYFDLVRTPPSTAARERIRTAINDEVKDDDVLKRRADKLFRDASWPRRRWFRS